jgi:hypothetical protein
MDAFNKRAKSSRFISLRPRIPRERSIIEENQAMLRKAKSLLSVSCIILALGIYVTAMPAPASADCPMLPEPRSFPGDTLFNNTIRSQMWITNGVWWGALSDGSSGIYFYKLVEDNFVKEDLINNNFAAKPDVIWNGLFLFILMHDSSPPEAPSLARLYKYSYVRDTKTYSLHQGFPIDLPLAGDVFDVAFDQDSTGKLWATYTDTLGGSVHVIWSTSKDHQNWDTDGTILASGLAVDTEEAATIVRFKAVQQHRPAIGVVWSNQAAGEIGFRFHLDNKAEVDWSPQETVDCCEGIPGVADNHLSLKATPDGRLFLIAKDALGAEGRLHLYVRSVEGVWGQKTIVDPDPAAAPTRPILVLDLRNHEAYVIYRNTTADGNLFFVRTSLKVQEEHPVFTQPCLFIGLNVNSPTSTKRALRGTTRLIAVASGDDQIFWTSITLGSLPPLSPELEASEELEPIAESAPSPEPELSPALPHEAETLQAQRDPQTPSSRLLEGVPPAQYGSLWEGQMSHSETPTKTAGWRWLREQGVKTIVALDPNRVNIGKFGFEGFLWIPLDSGEPPTDTEAEKFLKYVQNQDNQPVHLQSAGGSDRAATLRALVSYAIDGQTLEAALAEARLHNEGNELSPAQVEWLRRWAAAHDPGSHRRP